MGVGITGMMGEMMGEKERRSTLYQPLDGMSALLDLHLPLGSDKNTYTHKDEFGAFNSVQYTVRG